MKIKQLRGYLLINICSLSLQTSLFLILCRRGSFPNRCATLSFSRALCGLFNRVINFWISVFSPLFAVRFCMTAPVDRLQLTGRCISQFSAPSFRKRALALLCKVQAKWAPLPLALSTVVLESATVSTKVVEGWLVTCYWGGNKGKSDKQASRFIHGSSMNCKWGNNLPFFTVGCWVFKMYLLFQKSSTCFKSSTPLFQTCLHQKHETLLTLEFNFKCLC